jgi:hypothetical protein
VKEKPPEGVSAQGLARRPASWAETSRPDPDRRCRPRRSPRPLRSAVATSTLGTRRPTGRARRRGSSWSAIGFRGERVLESLGNRDFFLNTLSWLAEEENLIAVRPKEPRSTPVFLTAAQGQVLFWVPVVLLPLAMMAAGGWRSPAGAGGSPSRDALPRQRSGGPAGRARQLLLRLRSVRPDREKAAGQGPPLEGPEAKDVEEIVVRRVTPSAPPKRTRDLELGCPSCRPADRRAADDLATSLATLRRAEIEANPRSR